jgi:hypothetical protein
MSSRNLESSYLSIPIALLQYDADLTSLEQDVAVNSRARQERRYTISGEVLVCACSVITPRDHV